MVRGGGASPLHPARPATAAAASQRTGLEAKPTRELEGLCDRRAAFAAQLERERSALCEPSDLEQRIQAIEGAVELAEEGGFMGREERAKLLQKLVQDLRDDHHHHTTHRYLHAGHRALATDSPHIVPYREHPVRTETRKADERKDALTRGQEVQSDYIGRRGAFAGSYRVVPDQESWFAGVPNLSAEVEERDRSAPWMVLRSWLDRYAGAEHIHPEVAHHQPSEPSFGCGDVYVDMAREAALQRSTEQQMLRAGLPICGATPPVTPEWLATMHLAPAPHQNVAPHERSHQHLAESERAVDRLGVYKTEHGVLV